MAAKAEKQKNNHSTSRHQSPGEAFVMSIARSFASQIGRTLVRGILGSLIGKKKMNKTQQSACPGCSGTGQVNWFGGVSRFHFTYSECPECNGTGLVDTETREKQAQGERIMWKVTVDSEKCNGCEECVEGCPGEVYAIVNKKATVVNEEECHGCHTCEDLCETDAITVEEKK